METLAKATWLQINNDVTVKQNDYIGIRDAVNWTLEEHEAVVINTDGLSSLSTSWQSESDARSRTWNFDCERGSCPRLATCVHIGLLVAGRWGTPPRQPAFRRAEGQAPCAILHSRGHPQNVTRDTKHLIITQASCEKTLPTWRLPGMLGRTRSRWARPG